MKRKKIKKGKAIKNNSKNKKHLPFIIGGVLLIIFIITLSKAYAMLSVEITGNRRSLFKTTEFKVLFDDGSRSIDLKNEGPKSDEEGMLNDPYTFTISNSGEEKAVNKIYFSDISSTIPLKYMKIAIKIDDNEYSEPITMDKFGEIIEEGKVLSPNESVTYSIILWISSDMPNTDELGNNLMNTSYKSKITVESSQETKENT